MENYDFCSLKLAHQNKYNRLFRKEIANEINVFFFVLLK